MIKRFIVSVYLFCLLYNVVGGGGGSFPYQNSGFETWLACLDSLKLFKLDFKKYRNWYSAYLDYILKKPALQRKLLKGTNLYPA